MGQWADRDHDVIVLPAGVRVRTRELSRATSDEPSPDFSLCLSPVDWRPFAWPSIWVPWARRLPADRALARVSVREAARRCSDQRVEVAGWPAREQVGTALACLAVVLGASTAEAVRMIKDQYEHWTVATPWQARFISSFACAGQTRRERTRGGNARPVDAGG